MNPLLARSSLQAARAAVPRQAFAQQVRNMHIENKPHHVLPFTGGPNNKAKTAFIMTSFFGTAISLPLIAVGYQMSK